MPPFVYGHVLGALMIGAVVGSFVDMRAIFTFAGGMAAGAAVSAALCRLWPGYAAAGWRLWLVGTFGNPVLLAALGFSIDSYECLVGRRTGWGCMLSGLGPMVVGVCLPPPLLGLAVRWLWGRARR